MHSNIKYIFAVLFFTLMATNAMAAPKPTSGQTGVILNGTDYCIFLPPMWGGNISANEDRAVAFCSKPKIAGAPNARVIPSGFIKSANFVKNTQEGYVQITGRIDRSKYGLSAKDGGGQFDTIAPRGAICAGYKRFVQITEPDIEIFCIRCCKKDVDCPYNKSTKGCKAVLGGNYA